jgi:hypothetical protein
VKNEYVPGHVRMPAYIRGNVGVVVGIRRVGIVTLTGSGRLLETSETASMKPLPNPHHYRHRFPLTSAAMLSGYIEMLGDPLKTLRL